jgi:hypothetical protein
MGKARKAMTKVNGLTIVSFIMNGS